MKGQKGFWDFEQRLEELSREGDPLEKLAATVDFEMFRPILLRALRRGRKRRGPGGDRLTIRCLSSRCWYCRPCMGCPWHRRRIWCATG